MGRPPLEEVPEGERRAEILRHAGALFAKRGYAAVSVGDIADAVGVSKAAIYHHFPTKDALYTAMLCDLLERIAAAMRGIAASPHALPDRLLQLARATTGIPADADMDAMMRDVYQHLTPDQRGQILQAHRALEEPPEALMREGVESGLLRGEPRLLAHAFTHMLVAFSGRVGRESGFRDRPDIAGLILDLFLHGAAALPIPADRGPASRQTEE